METRQIRCYKVWAHVAPHVYNYPVYCMIYDGWSTFTLVTCISCGELFVIDWENPLTKNLTIQQIAHSTHCPKCNSVLKDTIRNYPASIKLPNEQIGTYIPGNYIPEQNETLLKDFFEIVPRVKRM